MTTQSWHFSAIDTLFFRESRPMESIGGSELGSLFPPSPQTMVGAIRSALGDASTPDPVNWSEFKTDENHPLRKTIGYGDDLGILSFNGVWINHNSERLYPIPGNLIGTWSLARQAQLETIEFMHIGQARDCDLGKQVRLAQLPNELKENNKNNSPLSGYWVKKQDFERILQGEQLDKQKLIAAKSLYQDEPRLGIARDNKRRTAKQGLLYQTRHLRLQPNISFAMDVNGLSESYGDRLNRLGGEGRLAHIEIKPGEVFLSKPQTNDKACGIIIYLLTPALIRQSEQSSNYQPLPGLHCKPTENEQTVWQGTLLGVVLTLHSVVIGKPIREGGWDLAKHQPKAVQSLVPAGSAYYCTVDNGDIQSAINALHDKQIGTEEKLGRGKIAVGLWLHHHNIKGDEPRDSGK